MRYQIKHQNSILKLLKAELNYYKKYIIAAFLFSAIISIPLIVSGDFKGENRLYIPFVIIFWAVFMARWGHFIFNRENNERVLASLPLMRKTIAAYRLLVGILIWLIFAVSIFVFVILFKYSYLLSINLWGILIINALVIMINAFLYIWHDFIFLKPGKNRKLFSYIWYYPISLIIIALVYFTFSSVPFGHSIQIYLRDLAFTPIAAIIFNLLGILLTILSYYSYQHRYSYLKTEFGIKANIKVKTGDLS